MKDDIIPTIVEPPANDGFEDSDPVFEEVRSVVEVTAVDDVDVVDDDKL